MAQTQRVLAVTGGTHGIGRGIAEHFARAGYAVAIADVEADAPVDISDARAVARWIDDVIARFGRIDVLVNNAGIAHNVPFLELDPSDFDRVIGVNLRGAMLCTQAAARAMIAQQIHGAIINIASTRAFMSEPNTEAYSASKGGIVALTHATAMSLAPYRIRVNCICPGWIETRQAPVTSARDHEQHPVGRVGTPEDIAEACLFLAERAGFMTGQHITLDGGMTVKMIYEE